MSYKKYPVVETVRRCLKTEKSRVKRESQKLSKSDKVFPLIPTMPLPNTTKHVNQKSDESTKLTMHRTNSYPKIDPNSATVFKSKGYFVLSSYFLRLVRRKRILLCHNYWKNSAYRLWSHPQFSLRILFRRM